MAVGTHDNDGCRNSPVIRFEALPYQRQIHHLIPSFLRLGHTLHWPGPTVHLPYFRGERTKAPRTIKRRPRCRVWGRIE